MVGQLTQQDMVIIASQNDQFREREKDDVATEIVCNRYVNRPNFWRCFNLIPFVSAKSNEAFLRSRNTLSLNGCRIKT